MGKTVSHVEHFSIVLDTPTYDMTKQLKYSDISDRLFIEINPIK